MALPQARITPTLKEKRYNTLNFLEASVMGGNKVGISQVDNYEITDLSGELFTYKEPIETYITFDQRPSVQLLRKYGWYRDDQEVLPIVAYIPTHLLYDKEILKVYTDYTNEGIPEFLLVEDYTILTSSDTLKYIIYINKTNPNELKFYEHLELNTLLTNALNSEIGANNLKQIYIDEETGLLFLETENNGIYETKLFRVTETALIEITLPQDIGRIYSIRANNDKVIITTSSKLLVYTISGNDLTLITEAYTSTPTEIVDFKSDIIILEHKVLTYKGVQVFKLTSNSLTKLSAGLETIGVEKGRTSPNGKYILLVDAAVRIRVYEVIKNTLKQLYIIPLTKTTLETLDLYMTDYNIYTAGKHKYNQNTNIFKAFGYNNESYINEINETTLELNSPNFGLSQILINTNDYNTIYLSDNNIGAYAEIVKSGGENYTKAVANYTLLTGEDMKHLVENDGIGKYVLEPLEIKRGTLIDIEYDFLDPEHDFIKYKENLFYVTDVKVDTISINYVANLMPYKYDNPNEGDPDSNIVEFRGDTRDAGLK